MKKEVVLDFHVSNSCGTCGHGMSRHPVTGGNKGKCVSFKCGCKKFKVVGAKAGALSGS